MQMSFLEEAPVKTSVLPEIEQALQGSVISGRRCAVLLESVGRESSFMRMFAEECQQVSLTEYVQTWNLTATQHGRWYILLQYSERLTNDTGCLSLAYWPTPSHSDDTERQPSPTPILTSTGTYRHLNAAGGQSQMRLSQVAKMWNTLKSSDWKHMTMSPPEASRDSITSDLMALGTTTGYLNPDWEELLMGLPPGYTDLTRLRTFQASPQVRASISIRMSHRAQLRKKANMQRNAFRHSATRLSGNKRFRYSKR